MYETAPICESDPVGLLDWAKGAVGGVVDTVTGAIGGAVDYAAEQFAMAERARQQAEREAQAAAAERARQEAARQAATQRSAEIERQEAERRRIAQEQQAKREAEAATEAARRSAEIERQEAERRRLAQERVERERATAAAAAAEAEIRRQQLEAARQESTLVAGSGGASILGQLGAAAMGVVDTARGAIGGAVDYVAEQFAMAERARQQAEWEARSAATERTTQDTARQEAARRSAEIERQEAERRRIAQEQVEREREAEIRRQQLEVERQASALAAGSGGASILGQLGAAAMGAITATSAIVSPFTYPGLVGFRAGMEAAPEILNEIPKLLPDEMSATGIVKSGGDIAAAVIGKGGSELLYKPISALYGVVTGESLDAADRQRMKELQDLYIRDSIYNIYATPGHVVDLATALVDVADETFGSGEFERTHLADDIKRGIFKRDEIGEHVPGSLAGYGTQYDRDVLKYQASDRIGEDYGWAAGFAGDIVTMWHDMPVVESVMWTGGKILDLGRFGAPLATTFAVEQVVPAIHDAIFGGPGGAGHDGTVTTVVATPENDELRSAITQYEDATRGYDEEAKKYGDARAQIEQQYALDQAAYERQIADYQRAVEQEQWGLVSEYERQMVDYQNQLDREYAQAQDRLLREYEELAGELVEATDEYNAIAREYEESRAALEEKYLGEVEEYQRGLDEQYQRELEEYERQAEELARQVDAHQRDLDEQYQREMEEYQREMEDYQRQMEEAEAQREMDYFDAMRAAQEWWSGGTGLGTITDQLYSGHSGGGYYDGGGWETGWVVESPSDEPTDGGAVTEMRPSREINKLAIAGAAGAAILAGAFILTRDRSPVGGVAGGTF
ncbi:MAG: hypothetical protein WC145_12770 [Aliarcobacter sp.]